jgi:hypothetical protein
MKRFISFGATLLFIISVFAQNQKYDIATFIPPKDGSKNLGLKIIFSEKKSDRWLVK